LIPDILVFVSGYISARQEASPSKSGTNSLPGGDPRKGGVGEGCVTSSNPKIEKEWVEEARSFQKSEAAGNVSAVGGSEETRLRLRREEKYSKGEKKE
jgi:hypothetical protein